MKPDPGTCKNCDTEIYWVSEDGPRIAVNAKPTKVAKVGTILLRLRGGVPEVEKRLVGEDLLVEGDWSLDDRRFYEAHECGGGV